MMEKSAVTLGNGSRITYLERASGEVPLVLLHGITDNARSYEPLFAGINPRCHVFALDFRGHGDSSKPDSRYDTEAFADDVRHFIREVVNSPVRLQGHSLGGVVAVQVGITSPELVSSLFLEDPPLYFVNALDETYEALFNGIVMMAKTLQDGSRTPDDWYEVMAAAPDPYTGKPGIETMGEERIRQRLDSIGLMKPQALEDALAGSLEWNTDEVLARLSNPVTLLVGNPELGAVITSQECARTTKIVGDCQVIQLGDVGHLIHDQQPEAWLSALNEWTAGS
ncbi:MAG: alpha/beta fold hydrolase [Pseudomonadales bacterium]